MNQTLIIAEDNFECCKHIYNAIKEKQLSVEIVEISSSGEETIKMLEKFNDELIDEILHCFSFNFSSIFYQYLIKCIDRSIYQSVSLKQIYKEITSDTKEKCDNIKWGVEKLIISMVKYTPKKIIREFFPYTDKPSTKIFIFTIADVVKKKIKNKN